ncbi:MAG: hypothetical protein M3Z33_06675 [Actinomycetota bacterium]|nr:hypothetical protein [Actinomycetota bacterium]
MEASGLVFSHRRQDRTRRRRRMPVRPLGLLVLVGGVVAFIAYLVTEVPVAAPLPNHQLLWFCSVAVPSVTGFDSTYYWWVALAGAGIVICVDAAVIAFTFRYRRKVAARRVAEPPSVPASHDSWWPAPLRLDRVPVRTAWITAAASVTLLLAGASQGYAPWVWVALGLAPWVPLIALETVWKYEHYGLWAIFGVATLLQVGHMGEHTAQVVQLSLHHGLLAQSHGIFGMLDFEYIHFFWDSAVWLCLCLLLPVFSRGNRWLWIAFAAASLHQVEHFYLFYIYNAEPAYYVTGGQAGIMGYNGVIGSPLARPYLHFAYNFLVVIPTVLAFWDQSKRMGARGARRASSPRPSRTATAASSSPQ